MSTFVLSFQEIDKSSLPFVGGKGANLGEMTQAGFPVPQGFCVTTAAYQSFIQTSGEMNRFFTQLDHIEADNLNEIRMIGQQIRDHLENLPIPNEIETAILDAWRRIGKNKAFAVRSSATAEDLPGASFAGQQDTYLNILGQEQLLNAVLRCFASLFTDRAISYRAKNGFDHRQVFLSVVIQEMIFPEVSGIMFTADPITGNRNITSIDASFGLGEALVSGLVSADLYQIRDRQLIQKKISNKKIAIYSVPEGGTVTKELSTDQQKAQALPDEQIVKLCELGRRIEGHYGNPQDIEWCYSHGEFYIVQSRPITSLYPVPSVTDGRLHVMISMGHIQMMTDTIKPLGISVFQTAIPIVREAGGRVYADVTPLMGLKPLRKKIPATLCHMDEQLGTALDEVVNHRGITFASPRIPFLKVASVVFPVIKTILKYLLFADPEQGRTIATTMVEQSVQQCRDLLLSQSGPERMKAVLSHLKNELPMNLPKVARYWLTSVVASSILQKLLKKWLGSSDLFHLLERSLPGNVTSELGLVIGDLADLARQNPRLVEYLKTATDAGFYDGVRAVPDSAVFCNKLEQFMTEYGMRCPSEIDISRPRWREVPTSLVPAIVSHIHTVEPGEHRKKFAQGAKEANEAAMRIIDQVRVRKGSLKAKMVKRLIHVYRNMGGLREHHKYLVVQHLDLCRQAILSEAKSLVHSGIIHQESDVYYVSINELYEVVAGQFTGEISQLITDRKKQDEINRKLTPPRVMTSDGEIITGRKRNVKAPEGALIGTPVSPGIMEGIARIVLHPEEAELNPGEIMIAPFTDPGWTPLFHSAKALVMEIGGMMTHGAVVAREYGIPAVVGIDQATQIIQNGAYIRVDGTQGYVQILKQPEQANR